MRNDRHRKHTQTQQSRAIKGIIVGRCIIKLDTPRGPRYLLWSSVVDAPVTYGMTLDMFTEYYKLEFGRRAMDTDFKRSMQRVEEKGYSAQGWVTSLDDIIGLNRAGPNESHLTLEEIVEEYCGKDPEPWILDKQFRIQIHVKRDEWTYYASTGYDTFAAAASDAKRLVSVKWRIVRIQTEVYDEDQ